MVPLQDLRKFKKKSGVYMIVNVVNGKFYIGSTVNFYQRFRDHLSDFKHKRNSIHLQHAYGCYGADSFVFEILESCAVNERLKVEQYYIDTFGACNKDIAYNIATNAGASFTGRVVSQETKDKISKANKGRVKTPEEIESIKKNWAENYNELVDIYVNSRGKNVTLISPNGETIHVFGIKKFCRENNLDQSQLSRVIRGIGKNISCGGWTMPIIWNKEEIKITDLNGTEYVITADELKDFCSKNGLSEREIYYLHTHGRKMIRGWTKTGRVHRRHLLSPEGKIYRLPVPNAGADFAQAHNLTISGISKILANPGSSHKGWTVAPSDPGPIK